MEFGWWRQWRHCLAIRPGCSRWVRRRGAWRIRMQRVILRRWLRDWLGLGNQILAENFNMSWWRCLVARVLRLRNCFEFAKHLLRSG